MRFSNFSYQFQKELPLFETIIRPLKEGVLITDSNALVVTLNPTLEEELGYSKARLLGQDLKLLFSPSNPPGLLATIVKPYNNMGWEGECILKRRDGTELSAHATITPLPDAIGKPFGLVWVFHRLNREEALHRKLMESERISIMGRLSQGLAHNLNNFLHIILGHAEVV